MRRARVIDTTRPSLKSRRARLGRPVAPLIVRQGPRKQPFVPSLADRSSARCVTAGTVNEVRLGASCVSARGPSFVRLSSGPRHRNSTNSMDLKDSTAPMARQAGSLSMPAEGTRGGVDADGYPSRVSPEMRSSCLAVWRFAAGRGSLPAIGAASKKHRAQQAGAQCFSWPHRHRCPI